MIIISLYRKQKKKKKNLMIMCVDILEWLACPSGPERYAGDSSSLHVKPSQAGRCVEAIQNLNQQEEKTSIT